MVPREALASSFSKFSYHVVQRSWWWCCFHMTRRRLSKSTFENRTFTKGECIDFFVTGRRRTMLAKIYPPVTRSDIPIMFRVAPHCDSSNAPPLVVPDQSGRPNLKTANRKLFAACMSEFLATPKHERAAPPLFKGKMTRHS